MSARRVTDRPDVVAAWRSRGRFPFNPRRLAALASLAMSLAAVVVGYLAS